MASITETELKKQIKSKQFSPVYLIYGSEQMFVKHYTQKLVDAIAGKKPSEFGFHQFSGQINLTDFAVAVQAAPFFSEYNCVLATDVFFDLMKPSEIDYFKEIAQSVGGASVLIISMPSYVPIKQAKAFQSIVKSVEKHGSVCKFDKLSQSMLERYIAKWANENGKTISHINASKLISYCGQDLNLLKNETEKISAYASGAEITLDDIDKLATATNVEIKVYAMSDAVLNNDGQRAFTTLDNLMYQQEKPQIILSALSSAYVDAYRIRVADECGVLQNELVSDFDGYKSRAFALGKARTATRRVSTEALRKSLDVLIEADTKMKTSLKDQKTTFRPFMEQLIARLLLIAKEGRV